MRRRVGSPDTRQRACAPRHAEGRGMTVTELPGLSSVRSTGVHSTRAVSRRTAGRTASSTDLVARGGSELLTQLLSTTSGPTLHRPDGPSGDTSSPSPHWNDAPRLAGRSGAVSAGPCGRVPRCSRRTVPPAAGVSYPRWARLVARDDQVALVHAEEAQVPVAVHDDLSAGVLKTGHSVT